MVSDQRPGSTRPVRLDSSPCFSKSDNWRCKRVPGDSFGLTLLFRTGTSVLILAAISPQYILFHPWWCPDTGHDASGKKRSTRSQRERMGVGEWTNGAQTCQSSCSKAWWSATRSACSWYAARNAAGPRRGKAMGRVWAMRQRKLAVWSVLAPALTRFHSPGPAACWLAGGRWG